MKQEQIETVRKWFVSFFDNGTLERLRKDVKTADAWNRLIARYLERFTGIEVSEGAVRHLRSKYNVKWNVDIIEQALLNIQPPKLMLDPSMDIIPDPEDEADPKFEKTPAVNELQLNSIAAKCREEWFSNIPDEIIIVRVKDLDTYIANKIRNAVNFLFMKELTTKGVK